MLTMIRPSCQAAKLPSFDTQSSQISRCRVTQLCQKVWTPKHQLQLPNVGNRIETLNYRSQNYNSCSYRSQLVRNSYSYRCQIPSQLRSNQQHPKSWQERNPKSHWCPRISLPAPCHSPFFAQTRRFNRPKIGFNQKTSGETCEQSTLIYKITDLPSGCHSPGIHMTNRFFCMKPNILWRFYDDISWDNAMHMIVLGIENEPMGPMGPWVVHAESWTSPMNGRGYLVGADLTISKKMSSFNVKDDIPYIMENKECSKPPTSYSFGMFWVVNRFWDTSWQSLQSTRLCETVPVGQSNGYSWHFSTGFINIILNTVSIQSLKGNFARFLLYRDILYISILSWIAGFITPNCFITWTVKFTFSFVKSTFSSVESLFLLVKSPLVLVESLFLLIQSPFLG